MKRINYGILSDGTESSVAVEIMQDGYNIIEETLYAEDAIAFLENVLEELREKQADFDGRSVAE
jgi:hypothetical protein